MKRRDEMTAMEIRDSKHVSLRAVIAVCAMAAVSTHAAQTAAPYTYATRYNESGQVTGTIAPDPDGSGPLAHLATRNTYGSSGATKGLLLSVESGQLDTWADELVSPAAWDNHGFTPYLTKVFTYDTRGRKIKEAVIGSDGVTTESLTQYSYDEWDRVRCKAIRMNKGVYGAPPSNPCEVGPEGAYGPDRIFRYTYDKFDQVVTEERAVGVDSLEQTYVTNEYAGRGVLTAQIDAKGNRTELRYDNAWRLHRRVYPSPSSVGSVNESDYNQYRYDENGNVEFEHKRNGKSIIYKYDNNNRLTFKDLSDNTHSADVTYNYDLRGLTLSSCFGATDDCSSSGQGETNAFNGFGDLISRTSRIGTVSRTLTYQYDREGNRTRITHPDGTFFSYDFDGLNRVDCIAEQPVTSANCASTPMLRIAYRPSGHRLNITRPGGATTSLGLDTVLRLESFTQNLSGTTYDLTNTFQYNPANQVTYRSESNTLYAYAEEESRTGTYVPNGLNQYASIAGQPLTYDANGNLTSDGSLTYTYDMENHLVGATGTLDGTSVTATLTYDPLGRLAQTTINGTTTQFLYDGDALVAEYGGSTLRRRYVHGDQVDEPLVQYNSSTIGASYRRYLHANHQGSIIAQSDSTGGVVARNTYDPYGIPGTNNSDRFGYTGQAWLKELGLYHYKARAYSAKLGRFLQADPIFYKDQMNLYAYVGNDPFTMGDPTGKAMTFYVRSAGEGATNFGHVAVRFHGKGYDKTYDFGRYRGGHGFLSSKGPGILRVWGDPKRFEATQTGKGDLIKREVETTTKFDQAAMKHFEDQIASGEQISATEHRTEYRLAEDYDLLENNCTTQSLDAVAAGEKATGETVSELQQHKGENDPRDIYEDLKDE